MIKIDQKIDFLEVEAIENCELAIQSRRALLGFRYGLSGVIFNSDTLNTYKPRK